MYKLFNIGKVTFVVFFAFAISFHGFSQDFNRIDSLKGRLKDVSEKNKIDVLRLISLAYAEQDTVQALHYINIAYDMSVQQSDSTKMIRTGVIKVLLLQWLDKMEELIVVGNVLLPIAEHNRNQYELKIILNSLAAAYTEKGKYDESLKYNLRSLIAREADGDKSEISISLSNIGLVYYRLKSYKRAIEYNKR
ncbi:MAG TPA: tetratricopeptide repeat protein, partial [Cyclobacteriaceae bacterium]|nr:tetratricopeptide repeat protein [Cyclobacteriaceae bacterium]